MSTQSPQPNLKRRKSRFVHAGTISNTDSVADASQRFTSGAQSMLHESMENQQYTHNRLFQDAKVREKRIELMAAEGEKMERLET